MLAGCATEPPARVVSPSEQLRAKTDPALKQPLAGPVALPDRYLANGEIRDLWNADRSRLRVCVATHAALTQQLVVTEGGIPTPKERPVK